VKFTDAGGVALRVRWEDGRARFEVADTGSGIAADEIHTIFEPFAQTRSGRDAREGSGLGLTISRDIAVLMDGSIAVSSEAGRGTTFVVDVALPAANALDEAPVSRVAVALEPGQPACRVLVVDDVADNRKRLVALMTAVGFEARDAANGREAVETWAEWRPHLVWMDVRMPEMDGIEATREIRRREALEAAAADPCSSPPAPHESVIIALTASAFEHDRARLLEAGCDDFIPKPYRSETLFEAMAEHLGARFVYDAQAEAMSSRARIAPDLLAALPSEWRATLMRAVAQGDVEEANATIDEIGGHDETIADELRRLVKTYQFEALIDALERASVPNGDA
jgi:CheY-like chemotaxis protein